MSGRQKDEEPAETSRPAMERESYGWLASSAVPAKKRRLIEGVSDAGVVQLQAQLYRTQQHVAQWKEGGLDPSDKHVRRRAGIDVSQVMQRSNAGVGDRDRVDRLELKKVAGEGAERLAESAAALERKAALYERLARGETRDGEDHYEVDFVAKGTLDEERRQEEDWLEERDGQRRRQGAEDGGGGGAVDTVGAALGSGSGMMSEDMQRERERRRWEEEEEQRDRREQAEYERRQAHKEAVLGMTAETELGRERAQEQRQVRGAAQSAKLQRLKAAFLQQQIAKAAALAAGGKGNGKSTGGKSGSGAKSSSGTNT